MKTLICIFLLNFANLFAEDCTVDKTIQYIDQNFIIAEKNTKDISLFASNNKISKSCLRESINFVISRDRNKVFKDASNIGCFDLPVKETCSVDYQSSLIESVALLDSWSKLNNSNEKLSGGSISCYLSKTSGVASKESLLKNDVNDILQFLYKKNRLGKKLTIDKLKCNQDYIVDASDSKKYQYFSNILKRHNSGKDIDLDELLVNWYPRSEKSLINKPFYDKCQNQAFGYFDKWKADDSLERKELTSECSPDTLYSWGGEKKLDNMKKNMKEASTWTGDPNPYGGKYRKLLYAATSPISTFGYGDISIRLKIKKNTPFAKASHKTLENKVGTRSDGNFNDFTISDSSVVESWSYGTPEHYDELVSAIKNIREHKRSLVYRPTSYKYDKDNIDGDSKLYVSADGHDFSENKLKENLLKHIGIVINKKAKVVFQKGSCRNPVYHFGTLKRTNFNKD